MVSDQEMVDGFKCQGVNCFRNQRETGRNSGTGFAYYYP